MPGGFGSETLQSGNRVQGDLGKPLNDSGGASADHLQLSLRLRSVRVGDEIRARDYTLSQILLVTAEVSNATSTSRRSHKSPRILENAPIHRALAVGGGRPGETDNHGARHNTDLRRCDEVRVCVCDKLLVQVNSAALLSRQSHAEKHCTGDFTLNTHDLFGVPAIIPAHLPA